MRRAELTGQTFGRLTVVGPTVRGRRADRVAWLCRCECGGETIALSYSLRDGNTRSCGCIRTELLKQRNTKHGMADRPEFATWNRMLQRCTNPRKPDYCNYGGRGITICDRWRHDFAAFYADMGPRPSDRHSLDRIDNEGNYEPQNCRWATQPEQVNNTRVVRHVTWRGETLTISQWAERLGMSRKVLYHRFQRQWPPEQAFTQRVKIWPTKKR